MRSIYLNGIDPSDCRCCRQPASPALTMAVYSHVTAAMDKDAADTFDEAMST